MPLSTCPRCSQPIEADAIYCQGCGLRVMDDAGDGTPQGTAAFPRLSVHLDMLRQATIGEYEILAELGQGGMATVYLAHDIALDRKVAIKLMSPAYLAGAEMSARFLREARTAGSLSHPHIVPVYAAKEGDQVMYFVMKYIKGRPLDALLRESGPLPLPLLRSVFLDVAGALDYAHRHAIIHRDVKPGNIMVDEEGFALITDFGIAKALEAQGITRSGTTVGTPSYLSPEACTGGQVTTAADQYSLGVVAYEMLTGHLPFEADTSMSMMYAQVHTPPRPSVQFRADSPPELHQAIMRMLEKRPEDRFASLKEAAAAVSAALPPPGEAVRSQIGLLAVPRTMTPLPLTPTPSSPIPFSRGDRVLSPPITPIVPVRKSRPLIWVGLALGIIMASIWLIGAWRDRTQMATEAALLAATAASQVEDRADSLWQNARGAAGYARERAIAAGIKPNELAGGDSVRVEAETAAQQGRKAEAAVILTRATALWDAAEKAEAARRQSPAPRPASQPRPKPLSPAAESAPSPLREPTDSELITQYYAELEQAIESRQLGEIKRLLPNLSGKEEGNWRKLFGDAHVTNIEASYILQGLTVGGSSGTAEMLYALSVTKDGKIDLKRQTRTATLSKGPQGWREIRVQRGSEE